jgi:Fe-S cluster assembly iron-binding protein IscA
MCCYLAVVIARDLGLLNHFPEVTQPVPDFFTAEPLDTLPLPDHLFLSFFERLVELNPNADTYFSCLATLHKARLKYARILETQPIPTIDQVGPRGLLQYGSIGPYALTGFILWRKWFFDIDNRAAQETGYLFEPIIAFAIGGVPVSASRSPVRRLSDKRKGRQVDCIRDKKAYEFKLRVTIAASGQGRWQEELQFPSDCKASDYTPVLVVLDPTPNPKLEELKNAFLQHGGEVYIGDQSWEHLEGAAGQTMAQFLEKYVRAPIQAMLDKVPESLPEMRVRMDQDRIAITVAGENLEIKRQADLIEDDDYAALPEDINGEVPGP